MKLATIKHEGQERLAIVTERGLVLMERHGSLYNLLQTGQLDELNQWYQSSGQNFLRELPAIPAEEVIYAPLYRNPRKILGIGFNYIEDLSERNSYLADGEEPVSFMKPDTSLIGSGDIITLPSQSERTTAEAELALIIGQRCKDVSEADAPGVVAGFTTSLDMTAADIHGKNPRFLTRSKSFDTFCSFGPHFITQDEVPNVLDLSVATVLNGAIYKRNRLTHTIYRPWFIVSFFSKVMTLLPGDVILTGTPGPTVIRDGDVVECRIDGFESLVNTVRSGL